MLVVEGPSQWPAELLAAITRAGYALVRIDDVRLIPFFVLAGGVAAVLVESQALETLGALALSKCRDSSPRTAIVVTAPEATAAAVKRALDSGATVFLSWPTSPQVVVGILRGEAA